MALFAQYRAPQLTLNIAGLMAALLLGLSLPAQADNIQDANKLLKQGEFVRAMQKVDDHLATDPKNPQARFLRGLIFNAQGKSDEALATFRALTEDYPELPEPYNNLAVIHASKGNYDEAINALKLAIRTNPNYATAHENLGDLYSRMAGQSYERAIKLNRADASAKRKFELNRELLGNGLPTPLPAASNKAPETAP